jgi:ABC-type transporter Mla subunit MlaD
MILIDAVPSFGVFDTLTQYGALGVVTLALGGALWYLLKRQLASEDNLKKDLQALQKELNDYIRDDQKVLKETIDNNTKALHDLRDMMLTTIRK